MDVDHLGEFVAIYWEIWKARNRYMFESPDHNFASLSGHAINFAPS